MTPISTARGSVFVDTSAFYAARDRSDRHHEAAAAAFRRLGEERATLLTTDHVVAETATLIRRKLGYEEARTFLQTLEEARGIGLLEVHFIADEDMLQGIKQFLAVGDPKPSFVDALSIVVCKKRGLTRALAFDDHFRQAGLKMEPP